MLLTSTLILAAENGGAGGIDLFPDTSELVMGLVAFLLLAAFMTKFAVPKLMETLEARAEVVRSSQEQAQAMLQEAEAAKRSYDAEIGDAKGEANRIIEEARATAEQLKAEVLQRAEAEAAQIVERAQADIAGERERVVQDLRAQVGSISVELAARIVERELDQATHEGLVDEYIQRLSSQN
ncbi:MAG: F0F1 ATP synthase subunit B [Nitriliruptoraceae bacterium]|nr:F0F1 ATP synthase subunit B [Nitriliruptoraceae bacterium]